MKKTIDAPYWGVLFLLLAWGIALMLFSSCSAIKKAERQTHNALIKYPAVVAKIARDAFPCYVIKTVSTIDSTDYKIWKDSVDILNNFYLDLFNHIEPILIHDTTNNCTAYKDNEIKYKKQIDAQSKLIAGLNYQIDHVKPIHDSTKNWFEDSAKIKILQVGIDNQNMTIAKMQHIIEADEEAIKRKNKYVLAFWLIVGLFSVGFIIKLLIKYK